MHATTRAACRSAAQTTPPNYAPICYHVLVRCRQFAGARSLLELHDYARAVNFVADRNERAFMVPNETAVCGRCTRQRS